MKHIALLIPEGDFSLSNLEATYKMFTMANDSLKKLGKMPLFKVQLVGASLNTMVSNGIFKITPDVTIDNVSKTDLIIIPAIHGNYDEVIRKNEKFIPWIVKQYKNGAEVASLCVGAFLLASTGLLNKKTCATHWLAAQEFRTRFPGIHLVDDKIITDENGIYTSGGAYSSLNLNLYLIEKYAGRDVAVLHSKIFEIDIDRNNQSPFIIFKAQKDHHDEQVKKAQEFIEDCFSEKITVDELSNRFGVSRRTFERRFKKATNNTIIEYVQRVRVEAAKKEFEKGFKTINEVMFETGYTDTKAFRDIFRKHSGMTPSAYMNKYVKIAV